MEEVVGQRGGGAVTAGAVAAKPPVEGRVDAAPGVCCQGARRGWWRGMLVEGKPPMLCGAFPGRTCALGAAACHGFGLVSGTIPLLTLNALCAELWQSASLL